jgi:mono/diheme cytochrome c family protein
VVRATVRSLADPGTYRAEAVLPVVGTWTLTISSGLFDAAKVSLPVVKAGGRPVSFAADERGQRLFSAKGCATCHRHEATSETRSTDAGPALTGRRYPVELLAAQIRHPKPCEPGRPCMPVLGVSDAEIASLATFLNRDSGQMAQR